MRPGLPLSLSRLVLSRNDWRIQRKVNNSLLEINLFYSNIKLLHYLSLPAYIFEITGSYRDAFFVAGGAIAAGSCIHSLTGLVFLSETKEREQICEECGKENDIAIAEEERNWYALRDTLCSAMWPSYWLVDTFSNATNVFEKNHIWENCWNEIKWRMIIAVVNAIYAIAWEAQKNIQHFNGIWTRDVPTWL